MSSDTKAFNIRLPREMWLVLKQDAMHKETSMNAIIMDCLNKYKKKLEKKLTTE